MPTNHLGTANPPLVAEDTQRLAERIGAHSFCLRLVGVSDLTPSVRRLRLASDELRSIAYRPGQDLMLRTGPASNVRRRYTIRTLDRHAAAADIDVVLHGDGPGARWARDVQEGEWVEAIGPRGKVVVADGVDWHLFIGDESFSSAAMAMAESLPVDQAAVLVLEVDGPDDHLALSPLGVHHELRWVHRPEAGGEALADATRELRLPPGTGHAYVGGEMRAVAAVKAVLLERGLPADAVSAKAYWRAGSANANHGEPSR